MIGNIALIGEALPAACHGLELVDAHVGLAEQADLAVAVRELGGPVRQRHAVGRLHGIEEVERAARVARAAHVGDDDDVAAVDEVVDVGVGDGTRVHDEGLAVRRLLQQHGERPGRRCAPPRDGRVVDVRLEDGAVAHRDRLVERRAGAVDRRLGRPRRRGARDVVRRVGCRPVPDLARRALHRGGRTLRRQVRPDDECGDGDRERARPHGEAPRHCASPVPRLLMLSMLSGHSHDPRPRPPPAPDRAARPPRGNVRFAPDLRLAHAGACRPRRADRLSGRPGPAADARRAPVRYRSCCSGPMPGRHRFSEVRSNSGAVPQW